MRDPRQLTTLIDAYNAMPADAPVRERLRLLREAPARRNRHVVLDDVTTLDAGAFGTEMGRAVAASGAPELLVFVHGYNVTFEEAARRAAQFTWDTALDVPEVARGRSLEPRARRRAQHGEPVVVSSLAGQQPPAALPLSRLALVAADIDAKLFAQQLPALHETVARGVDGSISTYATNTDRALLVSRWFHKTIRLGQIAGEPFCADGLDTIDATAVDSSLLGHSYFGQQRSVLTDLGLLVRERLHPSARGLRPVRQWWLSPA